MQKNKEEDIRTSEYGQLDTVGPMRCNAKSRFSQICLPRGSGIITGWMQDQVDLGGDVDQPFLCP